MQGLLAGVFGAATVAASINVLGGDVVNFLLLTFDFDLQRVIDALPATVALLAILGELGSYARQYVQCSSPRAPCRGLVCEFLYG